MNADHDGQRSSELDALPSEIAPAGALEDRTVAALRREGLLRSGPAPSRRLPLAAAAVLLFVSGVAVGRASNPPDAPPVTGQQRFLLLLQGGRSASDADEEARAVAEYRAWAVGLRREGRFVTGERLADGGAAVPEQTAPEMDPVRGYFVISAKSMDDAMQVAESCPHTARGGRVVVRAIISS